MTEIAGYSLKPLRISKTHKKMKKPTSSLFSKYLKRKSQKLKMSGLGVFGFWATSGKYLAATLRYPLLWVRRYFGSTPNSSSTSNRF